MKLHMYVQYSLIPNCRGGYVFIIINPCSEGYKIWSVFIGLFFSSYMPNRLRGGK